MQFEAILQRISLELQNFSCQCLPTWESESGHLLQRPRPKSGGRWGSVLPSGAGCIERQIVNKVSALKPTREASESHSRASWTSLGLPVSRALVGHTQTQARRPG